MWPTSRCVTFRGVPSAPMVWSVTSRKRSRPKRRSGNLQTTLGAITDSPDDMIWSVDPISFGLITFNRSLAEFFSRWRGIELKPGLRPEDLFPPGEYAESWRTFYERALREGPFTAEYSASAGNQILQLSFNLVKREGSVVGISVFGKDLTEQKKAESEAQELRANLMHLTRVNTLSVLSGSLAHELNQPLGIILSNAQAAQELLLEESPNIVEVEEILSDIVAADRRAGEVIGRLRAMLKRGEIGLQPIQLNQVIEEVLRLTKSDLIGRGVRVVCELQADLPLVAGDRVQLQQLVLNLMLNAADAMVTNPPGERRLYFRQCAIRTRFGLP